MNVNLSKSGNSLAVRIPAGIASEASIAEGSQLSVAVEEGALHLVPQRHEISLEELISGITESNLHSEVDTGPPIGNEALLG